ncbi:MULTISPECIES: hypothetical protein [Cohnella]|uniref:hypothetical protein n=1 Tax=Cohnella TaxID=329857 RepID=UPI0009B9A0BB|nr:MULTISPECIES: hypothetical protein [Cohnella]MBN2983775.1 hypothetical protein [Cohnella algarum]
MKKRNLLLATVLAATFASATSAYAADNYEPNDSFSTATSLPYSRYITSYISTPTDADYYKASGGRLTLFQLVNPEGADYDLYLYDANFNLVSSSATSESTENVGYYTTSLSNTYYVKVVGKNGQHDPDRPYTLRQIYNLYV